MFSTYRYSIKFNVIKVDTRLSAKTFRRFRGEIAVRYLILKSDGYESNDDRGVRGKTLTEG